ncbi:hypothetical protein EGW08_002561 [Elysia chlorotica]|uniref:Uncharacterized protein n=1 Tax=Elysia chlorotica TaxID=188477 RepID=A0A3S1I075_ELYCH|nr:hypothetical protein EGW08_002561 [Elysia chlorotica]
MLLAICIHPSDSNTPLTLCIHSSDSNMPLAICIHPSDSNMPFALYIHSSDSNMPLTICIHPSDSNMLLDTCIHHSMTLSTGVQSSDSNMLVFIVTVGLCVASARMVVAAILVQTVVLQQLCGGAGIQVGRGAAGGAHSLNWYWGLGAVGRGP